MAEIDRMKIDINKRDFFKEPFSESELKKILKLSGLSSIDLLRKRDKMFTELNLDSVKYTENELVKLMVKYPGLIKRPIIIRQNKTHVGKIDVKKFK